MPTAAYFPIAFKPSVTIHHVVIYDGEADPDPDSDDPGGAEGALRAKRAKRIEAETAARWGRYKSGVEGMAMAGQEVNIVQHRIHFDECELCVSSLAHALRSHTSLTRGSTLGTQVHEYIDVPEMARWLRHMDEKFWGLRETTSGDGEVVFPVFSFELSRDTPLLLDRFHQVNGLYYIL